MSFWLELYKFEKRTNSTARPVGAGLAQIECDLLDETDIINPTFILDLPSNFCPAIYNYAFIREFKDQGTSTEPGRFYYIENWKWVAPFWHAIMVNDPLASWRDEIGDSEEYIARSSQVWDGTIFDTAYPAKFWITRYKNDIDFGLKSELGNGIYLLSIINSQGSVGALSYYALSGNELLRLMSELMSDKIYDSLPEFTLEDVLDDTGAVVQKVKTYINKEIFKYQFNPIQYITHCIFYPFSVSDIIGSSEFIKLGYWQSTALGRRLTGNLVKFISKNIRIPKHPQSVERGTYLNAAPYSRYKIYAGTLGSMPLDSLSLQGVDSLDCDLNIDLITGNAKLVCGIPSSTTNYVVAELTGQIGVEIPLSQIAFNYLGGATTAIETAASMVSSASRLDIAGGIASAATGIESLVNAWLPQVSLQGQAGSTAGLKYPFMLESEHLQIVDEDLANKGRPYCKIRKIRDLGGFMVCPDPDIHFPATKSEMDAIKTYMRGGFYWQ